MTDIGTGVAIAAGIATAALLQYIVVMGKGRILHHQTPVPGHGHAIACHPGGVHTVEHVNTAGYALHQMVWSTHTHEIACLILRQVSRRILQHLIHEFLWFTYRKPAYSIAWEV